MASLIERLRRPRPVARLLQRLLPHVSPLIGSDRLYIKIDHRLRVGHWPRLDKPVTYNEKIHWLKLHYRQPRLAPLIDKYEVKTLVAKLIGSKHVVPTLGVWDSAADIDFDSLPDEFVLKCTHDSGSAIIVRDKNALDIRATRRLIGKALRRDFYFTHREYLYHLIKPRVIAEPFLNDGGRETPVDYKFYCFDGQVKMIMVERNRHTGGNITFYDPLFNPLPFTRTNHPPEAGATNPPAHLTMMTDMACKLSVGFPHVRVDFYHINGKVYFGELTFTPAGGCGRFEPEEWDTTIGTWLQLPDEH